MNAASAKQQVESVLADRFGNVFERHEKRLVEFVVTGIREIDKALPGFPRGAITEIHGAPSSGRTSILLSALAAATSREENCALVDCSDTFDVTSASSAGVDFDRLLWVRCAENLEQAFKAVDLLLHGRGFGLVLLNLSDVSAKSVRRVISSWWFRFRRAIENTPMALIVLTPVACVRSSAAAVLALRKETTMWPGTLSSGNGHEQLMEEIKPAAKLSLVVPAQPRSLLSSGPAHTYFLQGVRVGVVVRERPVEWSDTAIRFDSGLY